MVIMRPRCCVVVLVGWLGLARASPIDTKSGRVSTALGPNAAGRLPDDAVGKAIKHMCVQLGGSGKAPGDVHARWERDVNVGGKMPLHVTCRFRHPAERFLDTVTVSGCLLDVGVECTRSLKDGGTDVALAYSLPGGTLLMADARMAADSDASSSAKLQKVSSFHVLPAGLNVQPSWHLASKLFSVKLGRGSLRKRCPISFTSEFDPEGSRPMSYEIGIRQQIDRWRKLRARLLLPASAPRKVLLEYHDHAMDKNAVWSLRGSLPLEGENRAPELVLRRAWQW